MLNCESTRQQWANICEAIYVSVSLGQPMGLGWCILWKDTRYFTLTAFPRCHSHDDVIKWKHFPRYWPFVRGIHRSLVNSPHQGQWRGALMFSLMCAWINDWVNNEESGDLKRYRTHYDVTAMLINETLITPLTMKRKYCHVDCVVFANLQMTVSSTSFQSSNAQNGHVMT